MRNKLTFKQSKKTRSNLKIDIPKLNRDSIKPIFTFCDFIKDTHFYTKEDNTHDRYALFNFLNSMQDFCSHTWGDIKQNPHTYHFHEVDDEKNLRLPKNLNKDIPFVQFKLPNHQEGRFIGFFDDEDVFHIVLYDRKHLIYERK